MTVNYNPLDKEHAKDPYETLKEVRSNCPVHQFMDGYAFLSKHDDTSEGFKNYRSFTSKAGFAIGAADKATKDDERNIIQYDPPEHSKLRRLLQASLNAKTFKTAEDYIRLTSRELIKGFVSKGKADLARELCTPLPVKVFCHIAGVPEEDHEKFGQWTEEIIEISSERGVSPTEIYTLKANIPEPVKNLNEYSYDLISQRRNTHTPPDDLITRMVQYRDEDGNGFSDLLIMAQVRFLLFAGHETTRNLLGNMMHILINSPDLYKRVRNDRSLIPKAVEETLRWDSPVRLIMRTANKDLEIQGTTISMGDRIVLGISSANRDEELYKNSDDFSLNRDIKEPGHLAFGRGVHLCIGADLARLEASIMLDEFLNYFPEVSLSPDAPSVKVESYWQNGYKTIPVVFTVRT